MASHSERALRKDSHDATDAFPIQEDHPLSISVPTLISRHARRLTHPASSRGVGILVMGLTGAGKSTFISQITQQNIEIGHSLRSCTTTVYGYRYLHTSGQEIWLIDTPGFDDTNKANVQVLGEIASFLCTFCSEYKLLIGGVLYIHRITDVRMSNSSLKSLRIFEALCGEACFEDVTVVTTMWDMLRTQDALQSAERREAALQSRHEFFGRLIERGARYARHEDTRTSSIAIVEHLVNRQRKVTLAVQEELQRDLATTLVDTTVGKYLEGDLSAMRKKYEMRVAQLEKYNNTLKEGDGDVKSVLEDQKELLSNNESCINFLHLTFENLRYERGIKMIEGIRITADGEAKAATHNRAFDQDIQELTDSTEQQLCLLQEATGTEQVDTRYQYARNHAEIVTRDKYHKDKPRKESTWPNILDAVLGISSDPGRSLVFKSRRSSSLPPESGDHRASRSSRSKKMSQNREQKKHSNPVESQYQAQVIVYGALETMEPDCTNQMVSEESEYHQGFNNEVSSGPQQIRLAEIKSSSPETSTTSNGFQVSWDQSGLRRSYPNNSLRRSTLGHEQSIRSLYSQ